MTYSAGEVTKANDVKNAVKIINYFFEKNIDLRKGLRTGMYGNKTLNFNPLTHELTVYDYSLSDALKKRKGNTWKSKRHFHVFGFSIKNDVSYI